MENVSLRTVYRVNTDACVCVLVECPREGEGECEQTVTDVRTLWLLSGKFQRLICLSGQSYFEISREYHSTIQVFFCFFFYFSFVHDFKVLTWNSFLLSCEFPCAYCSKFLCVVPVKLGVADCTRHIKSWLLVSSLYALATDNRASSLSASPRRIPSFNNASCTNDWSWGKHRNNVNTFSSMPDRRAIQRRLDRSVRALWYDKLSLAVGTWARCAAALPCNPTHIDSHAISCHC